MAIEVNIHASIDAFDWLAAVDVLHRERGRSWYAGRHVDAAVDSMLAGEPGWTESWWDESDPASPVLHVDAGPKLLALCTALIEGRL